MTIVCIGDSCTYGQNVRQDQAWPARLAAVTHHDVRNAGVNGDTTRLGLERWREDVILAKPEFVFIQFGLNDANIWSHDCVPRVTVDSYVQNIREMIYRAFMLGAKNYVFLPHHPATDDHEYAERVYKYRQKLELGLSPHKLLNSPVESFLDDGYGLHPDEEMHQAYARVARSVL